jgi:antitoxin VapB
VTDHPIFVGHPVTAVTIATPAVLRPAVGGGFLPYGYHSSMVLNIKDAETDRLARELAEATGESLTAAVATAVRERLERVRTHPAGRDLAAELDAIALRSAALPVLDERTADEVLGYDAHGLPA